ncbi:MAG: TRL domain-containing protein [Planctomycetota bacterium]
MKSIVVPALLLLLALSLSACLYSNVKMPFDTDLDETRLGPKTGESTAYSVLWLFAWGDAGTAEAAKNGGLEKMNHMDRQIVQVLFGLYTQQTTIVYGN